MLNINGSTIETDTHGYLKNTNDWSEAAAQVIAEQERPCFNRRALANYSLCP